jgi:hypothetical protein
VRDRERKKERKRVTWRERKIDQDRFEKCVGNKPL